MLQRGALRKEKRCRHTLYSSRSLYGVKCTDFASNRILSPSVITGYWLFTLLPTVLARRRETGDRSSRRKKENRGACRLPVSLYAELTSFPFSVSRIPFLSSLFDIRYCISDLVLPLPFGFHITVLCSLILPVLFSC